MLNDLQEVNKRVNTLVEEIFKKGTLSVFLDTLARLPNVSYGNCLFLESQLKGVTRILTKETWEKYGKTINQDEKPLQKLKYDKNAENNYTIIEVFDESQTNASKTVINYDKEILGKIIDNLQKKYCNKYKMEFEEMDNIEDKIRQIIFITNDFSTISDRQGLNFIEDLKFIIEPVIYTLEKHFGLKITNKDEIKDICIWGVEQESEKLKQGLKEIQKVVDTFITDYQIEQKKYLKNIKYQNQEQSSK